MSQAAAIVKGLLKSTMIGQAANDIKSQVATAIRERVDATSTHITTLATRFSIAGLIGIVAIFLAMVAIVCLVASLWIALRPLVGPALAPLIAAWVLLLITGILAWVAYSVTQIKEEKPVYTTPPPTTVVTNEISKLSDEAMQLVRQYKGAAMLGALIGAIFANMHRDSAGRMHFGRH